LRIEPGIEMPGYCHPSLRDFAACAFFARPLKFKRQLSHFASLSVSQLVAGHHAQPQNVMFSEVTLAGGGREKRDLPVF
jgi:hypothetical protein